eukprot:SAG11_NODE_3221_length_2602_cov_1.722333_1_plen_381_part_10
MISCMAVHAAAAAAAAAGTSSLLSSSSWHMVPLVAHPAGSCRPAVVVRKRRNLKLERRQELSLGNCAFSSQPNQKITNRTQADEAHSCAADTGSQQAQAQHQSTYSDAAGVSVGRSKDFFSGVKAADSDRHADSISVEHSAGLPRATVDQDECNSSTIACIDLASSAERRAERCAPLAQDDVSATTEHARAGHSSSFSTSSGTINDISKGVDSATAAVAPELDTFFAAFAFKPATTAPPTSAPARSRPPPLPSPAARRRRWLEIGIEGGSSVAKRACMPTRDRSHPPTTAGGGDASPALSTLASRSDSGEQNSRRAADVGASETSTTMVVAAVQPDSTEPRWKRVLQLISHSRRTQDASIDAFHEYLLQLRTEPDGDWCGR